MGTCWPNAVQRYATLWEQEKKEREVVCHKRLGEMQQAQRAMHAAAAATLKTLKLTHLKGAAYQKWFVNFIARKGDSEKEHPDAPLLRMLAGRAKGARTKWRTAVRFVEDAERQLQQMRDMEDVHYEKKMLEMQQRTLRRFRVDDDTVNKITEATEEVAESRDMHREMMDALDTAVTAGRATDSDVTDADMDALFELDDGIEESVLEEELDELPAAPSASSPSRSRLPVQHERDQLELLTL